MNCPRLSRPVVLVHGLFGFDRLRLGSWTLWSYFADIPEMLTEAGNRVLTPCLGPTESIAWRAGELKAFLDREAPDEAVHVLAHSMGGLDARYMISRLGMADRVASLTTLGTPHRGTTFADWGLVHVEPIVGPVLDLLGMSREAFRDLTTSSCRAFNEATPDAPNVRYFSVAGQFTPDWLEPAWQLPHRIIHEVEGDNDGLVSVKSATHGEAIDVWDCDHVGLVNRPGALALARGGWRDRRSSYVSLLERLVGM